MDVIEGGDRRSCCDHLASQLKGSVSYDCPSHVMWWTRKRVLIPPGATRIVEVGVQLHTIADLQATVQIVLIDW
jgi:hypothetical protein